MNGPPRIAGFFNAATCICGVFTNDCMIFPCELAMNIAAVAGEIKHYHAYQGLNRGHARTVCLIRTFSIVAAAPSRARRKVLLENSQSSCSDSRSNNGKGIDRMALAAIAVGEDQPARDDVHFRATG